MSDSTVTFFADLNCGPKIQCDVHNLKHSSTTWENNNNIQLN